MGLQVYLRLLSPGSLRLWEDQQNERKVYLQTKQPYPAQHRRIGLFYPIYLADSNLSYIDNCRTFRELQTDFPVSSGVAKLPGQLDPASRGD